MLARTSFRAVATVALLIIASAFPAPIPWPGPRPARAQPAAKKGSQARPPSADKDPRVQDRAAVRAAMQSFVKAFESREAKAVAAHWTAGGEFHNVEGVTVQGRDAL